LTVGDDGVGLDAASESGGTKYGSRFVDAFVKQVGGTLARESSAEGTTFTVRLPSTILADA
jgi:signal transduction histidine kinase